MYNQQRRVWHDGSTSNHQRDQTTLLIDSWLSGSGAALLRFAPAYYCKLIDK